MEIYKPKIYVAGPYSKPDPVANTKQAIRAGEILLENGFIPFIPHSMTFLWNYTYPGGHDKWLPYDFEWVKACDALYRIRGESPGSDKEEIVARENGIPIYYDIRELLNDKGRIISNSQRHL